MHSSIRNVGNGSNRHDLVGDLANKVPKWIVLAYLQSYQSQMQYQASYRHNNLVLPILVKYHETFSFSLKCTVANRY